MLQAQHFDLIVNSQLFGEITKRWKATQNEFSNSHILKFSNSRFGSAIVTDNKSLALYCGWKNVNQQNLKVLFLLFVFNNLSYLFIALVAIFKKELH
jgi:hypothetical protein